MESYFSDIGGTLGLYLGMSLMSVVEFFELALDLIIYAILRACMSSQARNRLAAQRGGAFYSGGPLGGNSAVRMPWEAPPDSGNEFAYRDRPPPSYRAATRMSRAYPNEVRDVLLNM